MKKTNSPNGPNDTTCSIWAIIKSFVALPGLLVVDVVDVVLLLPFFVLFAVVIVGFVVVVVGGVLRMRWRSPAVTCVWCVVTVFGKLCSAVHRVLNPAENKCSVSVVVNCACLATVGLWVWILVMDIFKYCVIFL